jgi:hypothetical protein
MEGKRVQERVGGHENGLKTEGERYEGNGRKKEWNGRKPKQTAVHSGEEGGAQKSSPDCRAAILALKSPLEARGEKVVMNEEELKNEGKIVDLTWF